MQWWWRWRGVRVDQLQKWLVFLSAPTIAGGWLAASMWLAGFDISIGNLRLDIQNLLIIGLVTFSGPVLLYTFGLMVARQLTNSKASYAVALAIQALGMVSVVTYFVPAFLCLVVSFWLGIANGSVRRWGKFVGRKNTLPLSRVIGGGFLFVFGVASLKFDYLSVAEGNTSILMRSLDVRVGLMEASGSGPETCALFFFSDRFTFIRTFEMGKSVVYVKPTSELSIKPCTHRI